MKLRSTELINRTVFLFITIMCPYIAYGQTTKSSKRDSSSIRIVNKAIFQCEVQVPDSYIPNKEYPLIIALHGGGGSYETFKDIWNHFVDPQFIFATPQAPYKWQLNGEIGYDWSAWPSQDTSYMKEAIVLTSSYIESIIKDLKSRYKVENIYLLGFSQGSIIAQIAGINNDDLLKGIIIFSGPELFHPDKPEIIWPSEKSVIEAKHLKVFIAHGRSDNIVDLRLARKSRSQYARYGFDVTLFEFEGGHEVSRSAMREVQDWIN